MLFIISLLVFAFVAVVLCAVIFHKISFSNFILIFYLTVISENILTSIILHFFHQLNNAGLFVVLQIVLSVIIVLTVLLVIKPSKEWFALKRYQVKEKGFAFSVFLMLLIVVFFGIIFWVGMKTPPNNLDSLHTHLNRIYYWLQHGSLAEWPATSDFQLTYPINANLQGLWIFLLTKNENLFFLVAWFSLIVTCVSIYKVSRLFNLSVNRALIGSLVFLTVPAAVLQAYSFQNDLAVTALISITLWGILAFQQTKQFRFMVISALSLALALGVKQTAFMVVPAILLFLVYYAIKKRMFTVMGKYLAVLSILFLFFSSFKYFQNMIQFGSFFGTKDLVSDQSFNVGVLTQKLRYNAPRYFYNFIGFDGLPEIISSPLVSLKSDAFRAVTSRLGTNLEDDIYLAPGYDVSERFLYDTPLDLNEDTAWFGPLSSLLILISLVVVFCQKDKERIGYSLFAIVYFVSYTMAILIQRPGWDPYQGRYFILGILPFFPLVGVCIPIQKHFRNISLTAVLGIWFFLAFNIIFLNSTKPVITASSLTHWQNVYILKLPKETKLQRIKQNYLLAFSEALIRISPQKYSIFQEDYYGQLFYSVSSRKKSIALVNSIVPADQPIYLLTFRDPLEYALFGKNRTRNLYPLVESSEVPDNGYLFINPDFTGDLTDFTLLGETDLIKIYQRGK